MKFRFGHPQSALTGFWVGAAGSGLQQRACGRSHSAASGDSRNFVSTSRYRQPRIARKRRGAVDLDELAGHWTLLDDERELVDYLIETDSVDPRPRRAAPFRDPGPLEFKISELRPPSPGQRPRRSLIGYQLSEQDHQYLRPCASSSPAPRGWMKTTDPAERKAKERMTAWMDAPLVASPGRQRRARPRRRSHPRNRHRSHTRRPALPRRLLHDTDQPWPADPATPVDLTRPRQQGPRHGAHAVRGRPRTHRARQQQDRRRPQRRRGLPAPAPPLPSHQAPRPDRHLAARPAREPRHERELAWRAARPAQPHGRGNQSRPQQPAAPGTLGHRRNRFARLRSDQRLRNRIRSHPRRTTEHRRASRRCSRWRVRRTCRDRAGIPIRSLGRSNPLRGV